MLCVYICRLWLNYLSLSKQTNPPPLPLIDILVIIDTFPPVLLLSNQIILALHIVVLPSYCLIFDQPTKTCFPQLGKCMEKGNIGKRLPTLDTCGIKHFKVMWCLNFEGVLNKENKYLKSWQILQHNPRVYRWVSGWFGKKYTYTKYTWDLKAVGQSFQKIYDILWSADAL